MHLVTERHGSLPIAEAVEEAAEDAAFAGKGGAGWGRNGALAGDGLVVVGAGDGVDDPGLVEVLGAFDLGHVADEHAVAHDLGFEAGRAVGVPLGFAAAGQRHADTELADAAAEQVGIDAAVTKGVDHPAGPKFVHANKVGHVPERALQVSVGYTRSWPQTSADGDVVGWADLARCRTLTITRKGGKV